MVVVTGAAGFVGYQMVKLLESRNISVLSIDTPKAFLERPEHADAKYRDVLDYKDLVPALATRAREIKGIVHLGACTDTTEMRWEIHQTLNVDASQALWNFATQIGVPFVYASSAATYGGGELGYADDEGTMDRLVPLNPYGQSKLKFDLWALAEEKAGRAPPAWSGFKFFNVYGFGERHKGRMGSVVLQAFDQIRAQGFVRLFRSHKAGIGDGEQKRDFVFVEDVVSVLDFALTQPLLRGIYNLGSGQARSFLDLTRAVFKSLKTIPTIDFIDTPLDIREKYQYFTEANLEKLRGAGFKAPMTTLEAGVERTVEQLKKAAQA